MVGRAEAGFVNGVLQKTTNPIPKPLALDRFHANILGPSKLGVWPILDTSAESASRLVDFRPLGGCCMQSSI